MPFSKFSILVMAFAIFNIGLCAYSAQDAANTSRNKTQTENHELTARDQSNAPDDIEITRKIRQKVVAERTFSSTAKNIKIITQAGNVVLKGPVTNSVEKQQIEKIAVAVAGQAHVTDQLEIIQ